MLTRRVARHRGSVATSIAEVRAGSFTGLVSRRSFKSTSTLSLIFRDCLLSPLIHHNYHTNTTSRIASRNLVTSSSGFFFGKGLCLDQRHLVRIACDGRACDVAGRSSSHDQRSDKNPWRRGGRLEDPDAHRQQATSIFETLVVAMSRPLAPVPANDFVLPVPASPSDSSQAGRRSTESSWSQRSRRSSDKRPPPHQKPLRGVWRHTIGIILLLSTVILWTASNFLASVGFTDGILFAVCTDKLIRRPFLQMIVTPNHTLSLMSIHHSSLFCCSWLLRGDYGPAAGLYKALFEDMLGPPTICLSWNRKSKPLLNLTMRAAMKK